MADQITTTAKVKTRLGITDATDDALISELIDQVTDYMEDVTGRKLVPETGATYLTDTTSGSVIEVPRGIRTVTTLAIASSDQPDDASGTYATVAAADVLLRPSPIDRRPGWPATRILIRGTSARLYAAINGAKITGDWGFATVPPALEAVAIDAVVEAYTSRQAGASNVIGADATATTPWSGFFAAGSAQAMTLDRFAVRGRVGMA